MGKVGTTWAPWTPAEDAKLLRHGSESATVSDWLEIAKLFRSPPRSGPACRYHFRDLKRRETGEAPRQRVSERKANGRIYRGGQADAPPIEAPAPTALPRYASPFGELLGEPPIGRSALDRKRAGIVDA